MDELEHRRASLSIHRNKSIAAHYEKNVDEIHADRTAAGITVISRMWAYSVIGWLQRCTIRTQALIWTLTGRLLWCTIRGEWLL